MSGHIMRKFVFWHICEQHSPHSLISIFVVRFLDSIIPIDVISKISGLQPASVAEQTGFCISWSHTSEDRFSRDGVQIRVADDDVPPMMCSVKKLILELVSG